MGGVHGYMCVSACVGVCTRARVGVCVCVCVLFFLFVFFLFFYKSAC